MHYAATPSTHIYIVYIIVELINCIICFSKIIYSDLQTIAPEQYFKHIYNRRLAEIRAVSVSRLCVTCDISREGNYS